MRFKFAIFYIKINFRIDLLTTTLKMYPKLLIEDNFLYLLQVLTNIIVDSQDLNLKYHAYECLIVLEQFESQMYFEHNEAVQTLWRKIAKFAVLYVIYFNHFLKLNYYSFLGLQISSRIHTY